MKSSQISLKDQNMTTRGVVLRIPSLFSQVLLNDKKKLEKGGITHMEVVHLGNRNDMHTLKMSCRI
jgi:hypothetical protein